MDNKRKLYFVDYDVRGTEILRPVKEVLEYSNIPRECALVVLERGNTVRAYLYELDIRD
mgnify:CR=1 FL=1